MKHFVICLLLVILCMLQSAIGTLAMENIVLPFSDETVTIRVEAEVPDGFQEDMELYLNGSPYYLSSKSGYRMDIDLEPGEYSIHVLSYSDISGRYSFLAPERLNAETGSKLRITVMDTWDESAEGEVHEFHGGDEEGWEEFEPELIDLSDGRPYGTILISSETYGAVKRVTFCLVGAEKVYEITLKNEYAGCARVRIPVGNYYESGTMHVELAENVEEPEGIAYLWQHKDNRGIWGNYYHVEEGKTIEINDLIIMMAIDGDMAELNSNALFSGTWIKNREYLMESHQQKEMESAFGEGQGENQWETIASAEPMKDLPSIDFWGTIAILIGTLGLIAASFLTFWCRRRKE